MPEAENQDKVFQGVDEATRLRREATNQRFKRGPSANALIGISNQPTVPLTTAGLANAQNRGTNDADIIKVVAQPKVNNKPENHLGNTTRSFRREIAVEGLFQFFPSRQIFLLIHFAEVIEDIVQTLNVAWEKRNSKSLNRYIFILLPMLQFSDAPFFRSDVSLRLDGNQNIESGSESMTIGEFYDHHRRLGFFQVLPKHAKGLKGNVLPIEIAIDCLAVSF